MPLTRIKNTAIGDGGISTAKLADGAVTTVKVADSAVNSAKIGVDVIVADDLAANSVTVSEITDGAVTGAKLADNLNYDSGTLYLDSTNNRVGIGTITPPQKFVVSNAGADNIVMAENTSSSLQMFMQAQSGVGAIGTLTNHDTVFLSNNTERARLDSSGNLLVGMTAVSGTTDGLHFRAGIASGINVTNDHTIALNRKSSDGEILRFLKDGSSVGSIGSYAGVYTNIGTSNVGLMFNTGATAVIPHNMSTNTPSDNTINLGQAGYRWKDLYLSGGVYLGGTAAANHLDDYEEGEWTPIVYGSTSGTATGSSGAGSGGSYVKIGNYVWLSFYFANPSISGTMSGDLYMGPLPFTHDNNDRFDNGSGGEIMTHRYFNSGSSTRKITMKINRGENRVLFRKQDFGSNNEDSPLNQSTAGVITSTLIWGQLRMRVT